MARMEIAMKPCIRCGELIEPKHHICIRCLDFLDKVWRQAKGLR